MCTHTLYLPFGSLEMGGYNSIDCILLNFKDTVILCFYTIGNYS